LPELRLTRRARQQLLELPSPLREAITETLERIAIDPEREGKELIGRLRGLWSARVGSYRVLYTIEQRVVLVRAIRHRAVAYRGR
jgi:mRNA-degrading endonuclease RelE of RelBE toxin-antitoxin system